MGHNFVYPTAAHGKSILYLSLVLVVIALTNVTSWPHGRYVSTREQDAFLYQAGTLSQRCVDSGMVTTKIEFCITSAQFAILGKSEAVSVTKKLADTHTVKRCVSRLRTMICLGELSLFQFEYYMSLTARID